jgi:hypothetical protein
VSLLRPPIRNFRQASHFLNQLQHFHPGSHFLSGDYDRRSRATQNRLIARSKTSVTIAKPENSPPEHVQVLEIIG